MRVYIPFPDGSSIAFDGQEFTIHKKPKDIDAVDRDDYHEPCMAENAWSTRWDEAVKALEGAYKREEEIRRANRSKRIYHP